MTAHAYGKVVDMRGSLAEWPVFNGHAEKRVKKKLPQSLDHSRVDRLQVHGPSPERRRLPATDFGDNTADYYHCGGRRSSSSSSKQARNSSAPKLRPPPASITNEVSRRVHSMRILSTSKTLPAGEGLSDLNWRDDSHYSSVPKWSTSSSGCRRRPLPPFNVDSSIDSASITFSNELIPTKAKPPPRQQSPSSNKAKAAFKYLSAKSVTEKLVKALTKDRTSAHVVEEANETNEQRENLKEMQKGVKANADAKSNGSNDVKASTGPQHSAMPGHQATGANSRSGHILDSPPRASIEHEERRDMGTYPGGHPSYGTKTHIASEEIGSYYDVLDPLESRARAFEEQATMLGAGDDELSEALTRTLVNDGDFEYDTLEIDIDVLRKELRKHIEEKKELSLKMAAELRARHLERVCSEETLKRVKLEMESKVRMVERGALEMKNRLQEEMEENEAGWLSKYEKLKAKEKRLGERLKEILEEKVELHKEVSALTIKKDALVEELQGCQESIRGLEERADESMQEAAKLRQLLEETMKRSNVKDDGQGKLTEEESHALARKCRHKERELMEKQRVLGKLQKLCREQEKTIAGLQFALGEQANSGSGGQQQLQGKGEFFIKLQRELVRLTGIEQGLKMEVESYKAEALAAKRENAGLMERLGIIMKKLGNVVVQMPADGGNDSVDAGKPRQGGMVIMHTDNELQDGGGIMRVEEIDDNDDDLGSSSSSSKNNKRDNDHHKNDNMAIVLLNSAHSNTPDVVVARSSKKSTEVHDLITSRLESSHEEKKELEKLQEDVRNLTQIRDRLREEASNLHNALSLTNRRVHELEMQLASKEGELVDMQQELGRVREQKDNVQKEADFMGREAIRLSAEVDQLRRRIERLDEDVMVKDGQLSILRGALHEHSE